MRVPWRKSTIIPLAVLSVILMSGCASSNNQSQASPSSSTSKAANTPTSPASHPASHSASPIASSMPEKVELGTVNAMRLVNAKAGWAGGDGWIARTDDGGKNWSIQLKPKYIVTQLFALNDQQAWATLDTGDSKRMGLLQTTDGGKHWKDAGTVPNLGFLHFVSANEALSNNARTKDGGRTWVKLTVPKGILGDAYFHDRSNGWAVIQKKDNKVGFARTTDGGQTWVTLHTLNNVEPITGVIIRSAGKNDAWIELIGGSGMSQTSYSLFHTLDGGKSWIPVLANAGAGSGPAPGYKMDKEKNIARNTGNGPGALYVVSPTVAFMGGVCSACDNGNTLGKTTDGGKTWTNLKAAFPGYGPQKIAAADANHIWWINTDNTEPSVMYTSSDGGVHWTKVHTFDKPKPHIQ